MEQLRPKQQASQGAAEGLTMSNGEERLGWLSSLHSFECMIRRDQFIALLKVVKPGQKLNQKIHRPSYHCANFSMAPSVSHFK